jgi:protein gp37
LPNPNLDIVNDKSGPGARPIMHEWVTDIQDQCINKSQSPIFLQTMGRVQKKRAGRTWDEMPVNVRDGEGVKEKPQGEVCPCG